MPPFTSRQRLAMIGWNLIVRLLFIVAVVLVALLPGISTLASLLIVSSAIFVLSTVNLLAAGRNGDVRPPGDPAGDRFPRRPSPFRPTAAVEQPLPGN